MFWLVASAHAAAQSLPCNEGACSAPAKLEGMKIATWNINSIRARENRVEDWLDEHDVDVLAHCKKPKPRTKPSPSTSSDSWATRLRRRESVEWRGNRLRVGLEDVPARLR